MVPIFMALIGILILIPILLLLPSVFNKLTTFLHIILSAFYFYLALFLLEVVHWAIAGAIVLLLVILTATLFAQRSRSIEV
ncbi:hypothetical protein CR194_10810 [Salipaludibacillus keqinensis]|uniref:DUF2651 domain-containing protein n=1 Tax=Salipaludibacillus keqinensis TaxID=2045207 RepID=A0A323TF88_9BACI|nr:hypothetical protein [Salipaludibacillus keqinensis]PYZ93641.1 hypothetical protein CR194_10810 [Salipaludibacillus keqinensis]